MEWEQTVEGQELKLGDPVACLPHSLFEALVQCTKIAIKLCVNLNYFSYGVGLKLPALP